MVLRRVFIIPILLVCVAACSQKKGSSEDAAEEAPPIVSAAASQPNATSDTTEEDQSELEQVDPCESPTPFDSITDVSLSGTATSYTSPSITWTGVNDECFTIFQVAIGLAEGANDVLDWTDVPYDHAQPSATINISGLALEDNTDYYMSIRVKSLNDVVGHQVNSPDLWQIWIPEDLPELVFFASATENSVIDEDDDGFVEAWDTGGDILLHQEGAAQPTMNDTEGAIEFNGEDQFFEIDDTVEVNLAVFTEKTLSTIIKTGSDIKDRQVIFEEGGTVRGMNVYIEWGHLYCGFWNKADKDGKQDFIALRYPVQVDTVYSVVFVYDYSNYDGPDGPDGTLKCHVNDASTFDVNKLGVAHGPAENLGLTTITTDSRLHSHPGDIGVGAQDNHSYFHRNYIDPAVSQPANWDDLDPSLDTEWNPKKDGKATAYFFGGLMYGFAIKNSKSNDAEAELIHNQFRDSCTCLP